MTGAAGAVHRFGETALLVDLPDRGAVGSGPGAGTWAGPAGVGEVVPAAGPVLVGGAAPADV
ncbi:MAG: hypothetical protein K0S43_3213, partial [Cellulosimicrobium sp.]|nr:hypothetical protein [Cellulosimicrobium sp.]